MNRFVCLKAEAVLVFDVFIKYLCIHRTKCAEQMRNQLFLGIGSGAKWQLEAKTVEEKELKVQAPMPREGLGEERLK